MALIPSRDEKGIADVFAIAFMFLLVVFAGTVLHSHALVPLTSSTERMLQLQTEHLYKTLEQAYVKNYSLTYLSAIADNLVLTQPLVPGGYLRDQLHEMLAYLRPPGHGVRVTLAVGENTWDQIYPTDARPPAPRTKQFSFKGKVCVIRAEADENRVVMVNASLTIFELQG